MVMIWSDVVNACFEASAGGFIALSVRRLHIEKLVRGVSPLATGFFWFWGIWNLYYYPSLGQWTSFAGGLVVVTVNAVWFGQMIYYVRKERREKAAAACAITRL